ncbi:unnamed protein product [Darwinula stevensoni]|uniref:Cytochrome b5 heme-binding domain-containing protein n=1 Tax=Darwinula stevensoni TaxID=69355 RepID=A0A7R9A894_9CRUS|nr:unnamed protein product [Darwinula stevensoni]CAG0896195.1 unnamed protein product [Darwinula stevensoni]
MGGGGSNPDPQSSYAEFRVQNSVWGKGWLDKTQEWLKGKGKDDSVPSNLWRIHDGLYDLEEFASRHPGGESWIRITRGSDITEAFEASHVHPDVPEGLLKKYRVGEATWPRRSPFTFHPQGFYRTLKRRVGERLGKENGPTWKSRLFQDLLLAAFLLAFLRAAVTGARLWAVVTGTWLAFPVIYAHNFFHMRDNARMYAFDLSGFSSREWRISHVLSHHMFPNTILDAEITMSYPLLDYLPRASKGFLLKYLSRFYINFLFPFFMPLDLVRRYLNVAVGIQPLHPENILPLAELAILAFFRGFVEGLSLWMWIHASCSVAFLISLTASHHHEDIFHDGDRPSPDRDWGVGQLQAIGDRKEVMGIPWLAGITFGDHILHHLFPTVDAFRLPALYPVLEETCREFRVQFNLFSFPELAMGMYRQMGRTVTNPNIPICNCK